MRLVYGNNMKHVLRDNSGFGAMLAVVVIGAVTLILALSAALLGLGELDHGFISAKGAEAFSIADGCMEETLRRMRLDSGYGVGAGTIMLTLTNGTCDIDVTDNGGGSRTIVITGTTDIYNKKISSDVTITGVNVAVDSWEELSV